MTDFGVVACGFLGGIAIGHVLYQAQVWVLKRWGGRLAAKLLLKARNLRKKSVALLCDDEVLRTKRPKPLAKLVVVPDSANPDQQGSQSEPVSKGHNVIPFRKVRS